MKCTVRLLGIRKSSHRAPQWLLRPSSFFLISPRQDCFQWEQQKGSSTYWLSHPGREESHRVLQLLDQPYQPTYWLKHPLPCGIGLSKEDGPPGDWDWRRPGKLIPLIAWKLFALSPSFPLRMPLYYFILISTTTYSFWMPFNISSPFILLISLQMKLAWLLLDQFAL